ncbi:hypothetical protein PoB_004821000 [Plakobranchus ocellatus]|uniref:Uncharacterized protein n=1 Tax=Plakobranchus ocellatus TaxID=259542 RepID=A0AAV4BRH7_9GAST|nr:hypothetical protein PoB_004821000 [Plakobranchus ocellatus]
MLQLASGKALPVVKNCAALGDPERTRDLRVPILQRGKGGREVNMMRDTRYESVVVRKGLVGESQFTGKSCLCISIENTTLLSKKAGLPEDALPVW